MSLYFSSIHRCGNSLYFKTKKSMHVAIITRAELRKIKRQSPDCICWYPRSNYKLQQYTTGAGITVAPRLKYLNCTYSQYGAFIVILIIIIISSIHSASQQFVAKFLAPLKKILRFFYKSKIQFHNFCIKYDMLSLFQEKINW